VTDEATGLSCYPWLPVVRRTVSLRRAAHSRPPNVDYAWGVSPDRICGTHFGHEGANGRISAGPAWAVRPRALCPAATSPLAMPPQHRVRLHDHQGGTPSRHPLARRIQKSRSLWLSCGRLTVRVNAASCFRSARFSSATARCPRQSRPIDRRSTTNTVSIRDLVVHSTTKSSGRVGGWVMANHRYRFSALPLTR
jgi:hypothetical protein